MSEIQAIQASGLTLRVTKPWSELAARNMGPSGTLREDMTPGPP
jgi:hypothetical protein